MIRSGHDRSFAYTVRPNDSELEAMEEHVNGLYNTFCISIQLSAALDTYLDV